MMFHLNPGQIGYKVISDAVIAKYGNFNESIVVQLRSKHSENAKWYETTELLINNGYDWEHPHWEWEDDWWEGELIIDLIAAAPVSQIDISESFAMEGPEQ